MFKSELNLILQDGQSRTFNESEIKSIQPHIGVASIDIGGMFIAGPLKEYFLLITQTEKIEVPRLPENDREVLDYIFVNCEIRRRQS
ncbi:MAG: hypothetical protein Q8K34_21600 [Hydrogenophaga sp.]|uniref:hypothetical protein n=1 Tax=Hydrogenophaga sp. TaxID=1904254 RepID=UPI002725BC4E|nr:hypothetical protein [Hydrogenophaga sp.]MDO9482530.1 hypothetical protein [Hydrogenophaga sp.]MDP2222760.1 hypothetical protein [Hydrogenophaga sp.]MDP3347113.1 hypothetical protein [Hydrogenophaga sp.]MDP3805295.1 hypothetical protein [Hydrogenophaga sp.]MDP3927306.1 hypothetical protein [Hydrogenophaga sp.]